MSNHSIGTFAALLLLGCLLNITAIILTPNLSHAQLAELSDIQSGIFHLSHNNIGINAETFANDQYVDEDQAKLFATAASTAPFTPADENYPFYLVDHYVLDSDLEIVYNYTSTACSAYPKRAYLSRHNISYADYTDQKSPPDAFFNVINGTNPYTGEKATAIFMKVSGYEVTVPEIRTKGVKSSWDFTRDDCTDENACLSGPCACLPKSDVKPKENCTPEEECYTGWVYNTYVRVDSASVAVWTRKSDTDLMKRCTTVKPERSCLPPSAVRRAASFQPKVNSCLPPSAIRPRTLPIPTCNNPNNDPPGRAYLPASKSGETSKTTSISVNMCRT